MNKCLGDLNLVAFYRCALSNYEKTGRMSVSDVLKVRDASNQIPHTLPQTPLSALKGDRRLHIDVGLCDHFKSDPWAGIAHFVNFLNSLPTSLQPLLIINNQEILLEIGADNVTVFSIAYGDTSRLIEDYYLEDEAKRMGGNAMVMWQFWVAYRAFIEDASNQILDFVI